MMTVLKIQDSQSVRMLTLNRPERRNALDRELLTALTDALAASNDDANIHAVIITGAGSTFCSGLDLKAISSGDWDPNLWNLLYRQIRDAATPTIAAVNGAANTAGLGLVLACDFAIAALSATFVDRHAAMRILSASGMSAELADRIGIARAKQMWLTARPIDSHQALAWGLVNEVVAEADLHPTSMNRALAIAELDRGYVRTLLGAHNSGRAGTLQFHRELERETAQQSRGTAQGSGSPT
jgi:enoyl-CoA hydratase